MHKYTFDEIAKIDESLHYLATYEVTSGKMFIPKTQDEVFEFAGKIAEKFNYFKGLIQKGECTLEFIKQKVLEKNGAIPRKKEVDIDIDNPESLNKMIEDNKELEKEKDQIAFNKTYEILDNFFKGIKDVKNGMSLPDTEFIDPKVDSVPPIQLPQVDSKDKKETRTRKTRRKKNEQDK